MYFHSQDPNGKLCEMMSLHHFNMSLTPVLAVTAWESEEDARVNFPNPVRLKIGIM